MRADDLDHKELLELDPEGGVIRFAGQRALLLDAVAMGLLRKYLVENFGLTAARAVLTQFGFAHGWRMAEALQAEFKWNSDDDWQRAGTRIHALEGLFRVEAGSKGPLSKEGVMLLASYEAEQHLLHSGRSDVPVCWTLCGLTSGYVSRSSGKEIYVLEDRCMGKGDAACHMIGRTREEWGDERAEELRFFEATRLKECLDVSLERVTETLKAAERKLRERRRALVRVARDVDEPLGIVAKSRAMRRVVDLARRVAKVDSTVLITGESGSGKERIARLVHDESTRAAGPFIAVNCGAITETLLESELFGHARGAFTGATVDRPGLFEAANGGTLLLDEVGEISPGMQVKLLRALQERKIRRVGGTDEADVDVRVISATNAPLEELVKQKRFREDLFYRLQVIPIHTPPLRERVEDIPLLAEHFTARFATQMGKRVAKVSEESMALLQASSWPGNVRQLENVIERAVALETTEAVLPERLPETIRRPQLQEPLPTIGDGFSLDAFLLAVEARLLSQALERSAGDRAEAARLLGISSRSLRYLVQKHARGRQELAE